MVLILLSAFRTNLIQQGSRYSSLFGLFIPFKRKVDLNAKFGGMKRIHSGKNKFERCVINMLWTIAIVLLGLWLLGVVTSYTLGGFIHILLVGAIITVLIRVIRGKRVMGR